MDLLTLTAVNNLAQAPHYYIALESPAEDPFANLELEQESTGVLQ